MIFQLTAINCEVPDSSRRCINRYLAKIEQKLPNVEDDLLLLRFTIRKNIDKYHPPRTRHEKEKTYADKKPAVAYYEGSISFRLNKSRFYADFKGKTIDECIETGFKKIFSVLAKYKGLHYTSQSRYPDRSSIRKNYI